MNISRGEVSEYHFSSASINGKISILPIGTVDNSAKNIYVSDLHVSNSGAARTLKLMVTSYGTGYTPITLTLPSVSTNSYSWAMPYKFHVVGSTGETRRFVASAAGTGVNFSISGYIE